MQNVPNHTPAIHFEDVLKEQLANKFQIVDTPVRFEDEKHYNHEAKLQAGLEIDVSHWRRERKWDKDVASIIVIRTGNARIQTDITPDEARKLADMLYDFAATSAAHIAQVEAEKAEKNAATSAAQIAQIRAEKAAAKEAA